MEIEIESSLCIAASLPRMVPQATQVQKAIIHTPLIDLGETDNLTSII